MAFANKSREEIRAWLDAFHTSSDSLSTKDLGKFYTKDATLKFGNLEELVGLENIVKFFDKALPMIQSMKHEIVDFDYIKNKIYQPCYITYVVGGDPEKKEITVPAFGVFHLTDSPYTGQPILKSFQVYRDNGPVAARAAEVKNPR